MMWTLRRLAISAFVVGHLSAVTLWILPSCPIQHVSARAVACYLMPLGLWQYWGMFAPDPAVHSVTLEAAAVDAQGLLHTYLFPHEADRSRWDAALHYRHSKYAANFSLKQEFKAHREFAARHVLRQLKLPPSAYPVDVQLYYQVQLTPSPGGPPADPMTPREISPIETYRFPTPEEALP
jgi:hypothetical protein